MTAFIEFIVNGGKVILPPVEGETLLQCLRDRLGLTGAKRGCDQGDCGACTVLMDGRPVNSCLILSSEVDGRDITTIEGLASDDGIHPLQQAFVDHNAIQCGFCTPGMILTASALLNETPSPSEEEIRRYLQGNLCRCTGYSKIVEAIQAAAQAQTGNKKEGPSWAVK